MKGKILFVMMLAAAQPAFPALSSAQENETPIRIKEHIIELRKETRKCALKLHWQMKKEGLVVPARTIGEIVKREGLVRKYRVKRVKYKYIKAKLVPGELVEIDVKYVPGVDLSWSYQYRFIDTVTNIQYPTEMESRDSFSTITAFNQAKQYFPFKIIGIQTDNGGEFRGAFHIYLINHNITHRYIPKRSAPWNGKVERANRSIDDEYYLNPTRPWKTVSRYTNWYNRERPHEGKGMNGLTPYQKYLSLAEVKV